MLGCEIQKNTVPFNEDIKGSEVKINATLTLELHRSGWIFDEALSMLPWYPITYLIL